MWPEGAQSINEITKRPTSLATRFKNSMIGLVQNLSTKVKIHTATLMNKNIVFKLNVIFCFHIKGSLLC